MGRTVTVWTKAMHLAPATLLNNFRRAVQKGSTEIGGNSSNHGNTKTLN